MRKKGERSEHLIKDYQNHRCARILNRKSQNTSDGNLGKRSRSAQKKFSSREGIVLGGKTTYILYQVSRCGGTSKKRGEPRRIIGSCSDGRAKWDGASRAATASNRRAAPEVIGEGKRLLSVYPGRP